MLGLFNKEKSINIEHDIEGMKPFTIVIESTKNKANLKIDEGEHNGEFEINVKMFAEISHYEGSLSNKDLKKLNKIASDYLTKKAKEVTQILKEADSDVLGIQKKVTSHYPDYTKNKAWKETYDKIQIKPNFSVEIMTSPNIK